MRKLTQIQNIEKDVLISFYLIVDHTQEYEDEAPEKEESHTQNAISRYFPSSMKFNFSTKHTTASSSSSSITKATKTNLFIASVVVSQTRIEEMFYVDSFITFTLNVKKQTPDKYNRWTILQQDSTPNERKINQKGEEKRGGSNGDAIEIEPSHEIRLSDAMKKYYELPLSFPSDQFTETAIRCVVHMLKTGTDKHLKHILTKEETLETIALCNYLGLKTTTVM